jgi:predicted ATPase
MIESSNRRATAELLAALVEVAIAHGRRHYSASGEPLATTLAVLECLRREGFVTVEEPARHGSATAPAAGSP